MNITATYAGKPLDTLSKLIQQRKDYMGENAKDAAAATAITLIQSLRAETRVASAKGKQLRVKPNTAWKAGWKHPTKGPMKRSILVARPAGGQRGSRTALSTREASRYPVESLTVFDCWIDRGPNPRTRLMIARDEADALAQDDAVQRILKHAGLAKRMWGILMSDISGRAPAGEPVGTRVESISRSSASVHWDETDKTLTITINNRLSYATRALKGGEADIDLAIKKAANKISGQLQQWAKTHLTLPFDTPITATPFPEIVRRRKRKK